MIERMAAVRSPPSSSQVKSQFLRLCRARHKRKNYLFAGSDAGGERAAIAYTILGCCRIAGINPAEYLRDVLPTLTPRVRLMDLPGLLPTRWNARRAASAPPAAASSTAP